MQGSPEAHQHAEKHCILSSTFYTLVTVSHKVNIVVLARFLGAQLTCGRIKARVQNESNALGLAESAQSDAFPIATLVLIDRVGNKIDTALTWISKVASFRRTIATVGNRNPKKGQADQPRLLNSKLGNALAIRFAPVLQVAYGELN
jgi:hypothetical protein